MEDYLKKDGFDEEIVKSWDSRSMMWRELDDKMMKTFKFSDDLIEHACMVSEGWWAVICIIITAKQYMRYSRYERDLTCSCGNVYFNKVLVTPRNMFLVFSAINMCVAKGIPINIANFLTSLRSEKSPSVDWKNVIPPFLRVRKEGASIIDPFYAMIDRVLVADGNISVDYGLYVNDGVEHAIVAMELCNDSKLAIDIAVSALDLPSCVLRRGGNLVTFTRGTGGECFLHDPSYVFEKVSTLCPCYDCYRLNIISSRMALSESMMSNLFSYVLMKISHGLSKVYGLSSDFSQVISILSEVRKGSVSVETLVSYGYSLTVVLATAGLMPGSVCEASIEEKDGALSLPYCEPVGLEKALIEELDVPVVNFSMIKVGRDSYVDSFDRNFCVVLDKLFFSSFRLYLKSHVCPAYVALDSHRLEVVPFLYERKRRKFKFDQFSLWEVKQRISTYLDPPLHLDVAYQERVSGLIVRHRVGMKWLYLFLERSLLHGNPYKYDFVKGRVNYGETDDDALVRECSEEMCDPYVKGMIPSPTFFSVLTSTDICIDFDLESKDYGGKKVSFHFRVFECPFTDVRARRRGKELVKVRWLEKPPLVVRPFISHVFSCFPVETPRIVVPRKPFFLCPEKTPHIEVHTL